MPWLSLAVAKVTHEFLKAQINEKDDLSVQNQLNQNTSVTNQGIHFSIALGESRLQMRLSTKMVAILGALVAAWHTGYLSTQQLLDLLITLFS